tara:strand:- start:265 stop:438 length:174 start_codon:yes stop_codon:yes gene_type:complete
MRNFFPTGDNLAFGGFIAGAAKAKVKFKFKAKEVGGVTAIGGWDFIKENSTMPFNCL